MSLLREIQDEAINSTANLSNLLRKCKVLAARLGNEEFKRWVDFELSGYEANDDLPEYRVLRVTSKGHFSGAFNSGMNNADIPLLSFPDELIGPLTNSYTKQSVAEIESLVSNPNSLNAQEPWPSELLVLYGDKIYKNMHCIQAWKVIPRNSLVAILDEVKNRVLSFVLEIEALNPEAGDAGGGSLPVSNEKVEQIFNTYIAGSVQNVATGSHKFEQNAVTNEANPDLFKSLLESLEKLESPSVTEPITAVVEQMQASQGDTTFKNYYQQFMSLLADHIQVLGPAVAPYLPALTSLLK